MTKQLKVMNVCRHDSGFSNIPWTGREAYGIFACNLNCGFFLNYDPGEYPNGIAYLSSPKRNKKQQELKRSI